MSLLRNGSIRAFAVIRLLRFASTSVNCYLNDMRLTLAFISITLLALISSRVQALTCEDVADADKAEGAGGAPAPHGISAGQLVGQGRALAGEARPQAPARAMFRRRKMPRKIDFSCHPNTLVSALSTVPVIWSISLAVAISEGAKHR